VPLVGEERLAQEGADAPDIGVSLNTANSRRHVLSSVRQGSHVGSSSIAASRSRQGRLAWMTRRRQHVGSVAGSWSARVALAAIALTLAACVTNGGDPDPAPTATVTYTLLDPTTVGTLQVDITGLPEGFEAEVEVAGVGIN